MTLNSNGDSIRCGIYARYSSDVQRQTSIEDQIRNCRDFAREKGWVVLPDYIRSDKGISGASLNSREGLLAHVADAKKDPPPFNCLLMDTTARYGRELSDVLKLSKIFHYHGVFLYFIGENLDTRQRSSRTLQIIYGMKDEYDLETLRHNVHRGMKGAALNGHHTGGTHYGYDRELVMDPAKKDEHGRPAVAYVLLKINSEQAKIILLIFELRARGRSLTEITKFLNEQSIPGPKGRGWSYTGVRRIIRDELYRGTKAWNKTKTEMDPESYRIRAAKRPASEWVVKEVPELRIIPEDLWQAVQDVNAKTKAFGRHALGGMNRTAESRRYLFSGIIKCGLCGGAMTAISGGNRVVRYGCRAHRFEGLCSNNITIRRDTLEEQLLTAIVAKLQIPVIENYILELQDQIEAYLAKESKIGSDVDALERRLLELRNEQANITRAIASHGQSDGLLQELTRIETEARETKNRLAQCTKLPVMGVSFDQFREFVRDKAVNLKSVLQGDAVLAKEAISRVISKLILTPVIDVYGKSFTVTGNIDLFAGSTCVMLGSGVEHATKHYTQGLRLSGIKLQTTKSPQKMDENAGLERHCEASAGALLSTDTHVHLAP